MFVIEVTRQVAWSKARQSKSSLIIWISKQLVSLVRAMKGAYLEKGHEVTLLSISIMSLTPKNIS
jgi:hypothetical protein